MGRRRKCIREAGRRNGRCLIGSALKLEDWDLVERTKVGLSKRTIVGGVEGYLSTGFNGLYDVRPRRHVASRGGA